MDQKTRIYTYSFLAKVFAKQMDRREIEAFKTDDTILKLIGEETKKWFQKTPVDRLEEQLNVDFTSLFVVNAQPIESSILENKSEILTGLQNPVMQFYMHSGYDIDRHKTELYTPDHIAIEFGFMQTLAQVGDLKTARAFLKRHLLTWAPPYLLGIVSMAETPFYKELCECAAEFLIADYSDMCRAKEFK